jgi:hypothetical protein
MVHVGFSLIMVMYGSLSVYYPLELLLWKKEGKLFARGWVYRSTDPFSYWLLFYMINISGFSISAVCMIAAIYFLLN